LAADSAIRTAGQKLFVELHADDHHFARSLPYEQAVCKVLHTAVATLSNLEFRPPPPLSIWCLTFYLCWLGVFVDASVL
jgi:hypothetical protein